MEHLEMVEKIRERANVSYEEAKAVLEEHNWDLLEAVTALEKEGKLSSAEKENPKEEAPEERIPEEETRLAERKDPEGSEETKSDVKKGFKEQIHRFIRYCRENEILVKRKEERIMQVPLGIMLLILLFTWEAVVPLIIISMFFGVNYNFVGKDEETIAAAEE